MNTYESYPAKVEGYCVESKDAAFIVETVDEGAAGVTISTVTSANDWPALSAAILKALQSLKLEGDA